MSQKLRVGIIGSTGYVGMELVRVLLAHPGFRLSYLSSQTYTGKAFSEVYPAFKGLCDIILQPIDMATICASCDLVITALPHGVSSQYVPELLEHGIKVLDHSGDFRFDRIKVYEKAYGLKHPAPKLLKEAVYGIPELYREALRDAKLISNPGCYPTAGILTLAPLLKQGLVETQTLIVDAVSGVSGAGRKADVAYSYCEMNEEYKPYGVTGHRHQPEMVQEMSKLAGEEVQLAFTPHLAPFKRGMMVTAYARPLAKSFKVNGKNRSYTNESLNALYESFYKYDAFVRILKPSVMPSVAAVRGSNYIDVSPVFDPDSGLIKVFSAQDNLGKGAATQAVQALNVLAGYPETEGLAELIFAL